MAWIDKEGIVTRVVGLWSFNLGRAKSLRAISSRVESGSAHSKILEFPLES